MRFKTPFIDCLVFKYKLALFYTLYCVLLKTEKKINKFQKKYHREQLIVYKNIVVLLLAQVRRCI